MFIYDDDIFIKLIIYSNTFTFCVDVMYITNFGLSNSLTTSIITVDVVRTLFLFHINVLLSMSKFLSIIYNNNKIIIYVKKISLIIEKTHILNSNNKNSMRPTTWYLLKPKSNHNNKIIQIIPCDFFSVCTTWRIT